MDPKLGGQGPVQGGLGLMFGAAAFALFALLVIVGAIGYVLMR